MQKVMKDEVNERYSIILRNLNVNWKLELKNKSEELKRIGLNTSGVGIKSMYDLIEKLVYSSIENLDMEIKLISEEFNAVIPFKTLKHYIQKFEKAIYGHIDSMQEDIKNTFQPMTPSCETSFDTQIDNIKGNTKAKLDRIYSKNKNLQKFKKIEWLVLINTIIALGGLVVGIISLFKDSNQVQYLTIFFKNI